MKHREEERKMSKQVKAVINHNFKHPWVIVDQNTGEILDDAQGYGYRTAQKAQPHLHKCGFFCALVFILSSLV